MICHNDCIYKHRTQKLQQLTLLLQSFNVVQLKLNSLRFIKNRVYYYQLLLLYRCYVILQVNLARETLKGLLAHWLTKGRQRFGSQASANGEVPSGKDISARGGLTLSRVEVDGNAETDSAVYLPFEFSTTSPPSIITEGSQGGPWRKKIICLDGTEDEKDFPWWCLDCVLNNRLPPRENTK